MDEIDFSCEMDFHVELKIHDKNLFGKLIFPKETSAYLELIVNDIFLALNNECNEIIECKCGHDIYTLMGCNKIGKKIFPKFIIKNKPTDLDNFDEIEISITQLNIILHDGHFSNKFVDDVFISPVNKSNFKVDVIESDSIKSISDEWFCWSNISHEKDVITKLTQRHIISIKAKRSLNYEEVIKEARHICLLFTLLTLIQLHINFAWVIHKNKRYCIYFQSIKQNSINKIEWHHSIINLKHINSDTWTNVINKSYENVSFDKIWSRFYGMLSYNSYWEYDFLGFISILDYYLSLKYKFNKKHLNSFKNRYITQMNNISKNINKFISLSLEQFQRLLNVRNGVAHSDPDKLDVLDDISFLMILKKRLIILLNYLALKDLGISDNIYADSALDSFNPILLHSMPSKKWLHKVIGDTQTVILLKENFEQLKKTSQNINNLIIIRKKTDEIIYEDRLTKIFNKNMHTAYEKYENICDYVDNEITKYIDGKFVSKYTDRLHIHTIEQDDFIEATSVYILQEIN
ncbi:conserved protein of unknown function [Enterobacter cancerogenus]|uniref:HEPN domain-containing protein n=1 Tax=Enterobacter cancerogenus TaxID=69218 RepID=UPI00192953D8|nr:HEPN domain-containing protein [Enterobacter cancerogenus]CAD5351276.1 conserved protein of unknown function [Enterobacter cancerogenus]